MTTEIELKLRLCPQNLNDQHNPLVNFLSAHAQSDGEKQLNNSYYDSDDLALSAARAALRIRQKGDSFEQTLKTAGTAKGGLHQRREWNWPLTTNALNAEVLNDADVQQYWPAGLAIDQLQALFSTNFQRRAWRWTIEVDGKTTTAEVVIDQGEVQAGAEGDSKTQLLCELELELLEGDAEGLWHMAQQLSEQLPLWLSDISKAERGYRLASVTAKSSTGGQWAEAELRLDENQSLAHAVPLWLQQQLSLFKRSLEKALWDEDSQAALECSQHWLALRHLPQWCGKIIKRKQTKELRQALDLLQPGIEALAALTTASRFFNDADIRQRWLNLAQQLRNDKTLAQAGLQIALWSYQQLPLLAQQAEEGVGVSGETLSHYFHRSWKESQQTLHSPHEHWHVNQWAELQSQTGRLQHLHALRVQLGYVEANAPYQRQRRLLSDMLNGQSLIQSLMVQPELLAAEQIEQLSQELPYELWGRWQELTNALRSA